MNVLYLIHRSWPYHGGSERYVWEHAVETVNRGHRAVIATTDAWDMSLFAGRGGKRLPSGVFHHRGVEIRRFPVVNPPFQNLVRAAARRLLPGGPDRFFYPNPFVPAMDRWIAGAGGFQLVHANAMPFLIHAGWRYASKHHVPLVTVPHANIGSREHRIEPLRYFAGDQKKIYRDSAMLIAQNSFEAEVYSGECGVSPERIFIQGSGIDPMEWKGASSKRAREVLGIPRGMKLVLSVTAHCRDKGSNTLLDAAISLWEKGLEFMLVLAGPVMEDFRVHLNSRSGRIPGDRLAVTGYVGEEHRRDLFAAADVVAAPSRLDAFGIVILDGWICEKPVIGCRAGGMPDIIENGKNGFLVEFDDADALAERIQVLLEDRELAEKTGSEGKIRVLEQYTWQKSISRFFQEAEKRGIWKG